MQTMSTVWAFTYPDTSTAPYNISPQQTTFDYRNCVRGASTIFELYLDFIVAVRWSEQSWQKWVRRKTQLRKG